jgi:hypothetical protein
MGTRRKSLIGWVAVVGALLAILLASPAQAVTIKGGDPAHQAAVVDVLNSRPKLLAFVESVYPDFTVWIGYGGHAWEGRIDVCVTRTGKAFTDEVAHEFCHEVQRAADAAGGTPALSGPWLDELTRRGYGPETWVWGLYAPLWGLRDPWEALAENLKRAYFSPYYTLTTTPDTVLCWLSRADMTAFLEANGIEP